MSEVTEAWEYGRCERCGRFSGPEVFCVRCDAARDGEETQTMVIVDLLTRGGEHVARISVPALSPMPEAIVWGSRFFFKRGAAGAYTSSPDADHWDYHEGTVWACGQGGDGERERPS